MKEEAAMKEEVPMKVGKEEAEAMKDKEVTKEEKKVRPEKDTEKSPEDGDESGDSDEEMSEDEDPELEPDATPEELMKQGKELLKEEDFGKALSRFSWAVQLKERQLQAAESKRDFPPELAPFCLDYGNALLVKEEHSNELFAFGEGGTSEAPKASSQPSGESASSQPQPSTSSDAAGNKEASPNSVEREEADASNIKDEQLAWEVLEMARKCYANRLEDQKKKNDVYVDDVVDATFVSIRLGDMLTLQEKFAEACKEYEEALSTRRAFNLPYPRLQAPTLSLAQAQLFSGQPQDALNNFQLALKLIEDNLAGVQGHTVPDEKRNDFQATVEDLKIQIKETEKLMTSGESPAGAPRTVDGRVRFLPEEAGSTTSTFDEPRIQSEAVSIPIDKPQAEANSKKKRRIDLSEVNAKLSADSASSGME